MTTLTQKSRFSDSRGNMVQLGKRIGSGGEGDVFEIAAPDRRMVAKIYKKPIGQKKQEKLQLMARGCNDDLKGIAAWPTDVLYAIKGGPVCGFVMPRVTGYEPIHKVYGPSHRKDLYPDADWRFLLRAAKNLAAAFDVIHTYGYAIGDVNEGNILINDKACVQLIDCDSFQVQARGQVFYCEVGVAHFTPPEIQNLNDYKQLRTPNQDNFGLAILIFLLLFMGRHPFAGVYSGKGDMPIERAIAEYRFAFSKNAKTKQIAPPPDSVGLSIVPAEISARFEQAFSETGAKLQDRPSAGDWWNALDALEKSVRACTVNPVHRYYAGLPACPWCRLERATGVRFFLNADPISRIDISKEWHKVEHVTAPGPAPSIRPGDYPCTPRALSLPVSRACAFTKFRQMAAVVIVMVGILLGYLLSAEYWEILLLLAIGCVIGLMPGSDAAEKKRRGILYDNARYNWELWSRKWKKEAGDEEYVAQYNDLIRLRRLFETLEREYRAAQVSLQGGTSRQRQLALHLSHCYIDNYPSVQLRPNQRSVLRSFGIETASDITITRLNRVHDLDDASKKALLVWRQRMEQSFVFDPSKGIDKSEMKAMVQRFQPRLNALERDMQQGVERLYQVRQKILNNRARFRPHTEKSARELAQAHADLQVLGPGLRDLF